MLSLFRSAETNAVSNQLAKYSLVHLFRRFIYGVLLTATALSVSPLKRPKSSVPVAPCSLGSSYLCRSYFQIRDVRIGSMRDGFRATNGERLAPAGKVASGGLNRSGQRKALFQAFNRMSSLLLLLLFSSAPVWTI